MSMEVHGGAVFFVYIHSAANVLSTTKKKALMHSLKPKGVFHSTDRDIKLRADDLRVSL